MSILLCKVSACGALVRYPLTWPRYFVCGLTALDCNMSSSMRGLRPASVGWLLRHMAFHTARQLCSECESWFMQRLWLQHTLWMWIESYVRVLDRLSSIWSSSGWVDSFMIYHFRWMLASHSHQLNMYIGDSIYLGYLASITQKSI